MSSEGLLHREGLIAMFALKNFFVTSFFNLLGQRKWNKFLDSLLLEFGVIRWILVIMPDSVQI